MTKVPIFVSEDGGAKVVDFGTVLYDHVYRDCLVVNNRGKTALKCELELPEHARALRGCLEFLPPLGFPQVCSFIREERPQLRAACCLTPPPPPPPPPPPLNCTKYLGFRFLLPPRSSSSFPPLQSGSFFRFQLKFTPKEKIWKQIGEYGDRETGIVEVPMVVTVPDQSLPVRQHLSSL
eukprot:SAG22_NODE_1051_length_5815_cov_32.434570_5_plen_179_part_00